MDVGGKWPDTLSINGGCLVSFPNQNLGHFSLGKFERLSVAPWFGLLGISYRLSSLKNGSTNYVLSCVRKSADPVKDYEDGLHSYSTPEY